MRWGVLAGLFVFTLLLAPAQAASELEMHRAGDGTWIVVGSGWHPGDKLVVTVGPARFLAFADGAGDFEVQTGLQSLQGEVAVHHQPAGDMPMLQLASPGPHPLAVALVQGMAEGVVLMGALVGVLLLALGMARWSRASRL